MADPFMGEIRMMAFNFPPKGWALCNGQLLPINQNQALFSLIGTYYGGDGRATFALPTLQGRAPMHPGQGPGLSLHGLGESGGSQTVTLLESEIPTHSHSIAASEADGLERAPVGQLFATGIGVSAYAPQGPLTHLNPGAVASAGGGSPHNNLMPYLTFRFCIALQGIYPLAPDVESPTANDVALRPFEPGDEEFLYRVYASTREAELALVDWAEAQSRYYREQYAEAAFEVILSSGRPVGWLYVARWPEEIRIVDIALLPEHRGLGIGTHLLGDLISESEASGKPLSIHVERFNPVLRFYERLRFRTVADKGVYLLMERPPRAR